MHHSTLRVAIVLLAVLLAGTSGLAAIPAQDASEEPRICVRAIVTDSEVHPISGANVQLVRLDENDQPMGEPRVALAYPDGWVEFCGVGLGRYLVRAEITGFVPTRIGPIPVTEDNHWSEEIFSLLIVLNPTLVVG